MIKIYNLSKTLIISDTHIGHSNIIHYAGRPSNHEQIMLNNLKVRKVRGKIEMFIHCGDVALFKNKLNTRAKALFRKFPGKKKILIKGNHDRKYIVSLPWHEIFKKYIILKYKNIKIFIQHYPFDFKKLPNANILIHGHTHTNGDPRQYRTIGDKLIVNACVELWQYRPFTLLEVVKEFRARKKVSLPWRWTSGQKHE